VKLNVKVALVTGAWGYPEDIAASITHLFSDDASYITGQVLAVDGGWCIA
jgi:NAD(P)-dependent dehydrogenase (short-subunit alcohol dehydrogenase family)